APAVPCHHRAVPWIMTSRPAAVVFDVIETLMPPAPLRERFAAAGLPPYLLELWFTRTLRDGMALAATGGTRRLPRSPGKRCGPCPGPGRTRPRSPPCWSA